MEDNTISVRAHQCRGGERARLDGRQQAAQDLLALQGREEARRLPLPHQYRFCCVSETSANTEDVMPLFMASDTDALLRNNRVLYDNVDEAQVLTVLERPTRLQPFKSMYLRYTSYAAPRPMNDRDLCVVVATDMFTHDDGSTVSYCLWDSVDIPECPDYSKSRGLVRGRIFRSGFFCRTVTDGADGSTTTKIVYLVGMEPGGAMAPRLAAWMLMDKFSGVLSRLCSHFRRRHLDPTAFRPRREWPSARNARACRACARSLGSRFTRRHHCVACGDVFCRACYCAERVDVPGVGRASVRVCVQCLELRGVDVAVDVDMAASALRVGDGGVLPMSRPPRFEDAPLGAPLLLDDAAVHSLRPRRDERAAPASFH